MHYFGTDGIRGTYGQFPISNNFARQLGRAVAMYLQAKERGVVKEKVLLLGRDTRFSGKGLTEAFCRGLGKPFSGFSLRDLGVLPTPALAMAVTALKADLGLMVTASHNPATDNGFKLLGPGGQKLPDADLSEIEKHLEGIGAHREDEMAPSDDGDSPGPEPAPEAAAFSKNYVAGLRSHLPRRTPLKRLVIDAAHGATGALVEGVFAGWGPEIAFVAREPDGHNINAGVGSEHTEFLSQQVQEYGADLGIAFDGDGDRCVFCDAAGERIPGDQILGIFALDLERRGRLAGHRCVVTVMSNAGLDRSLGRHGIRVLRSDVGDAQVWSQMLASGARFGGEASGHIIFRDLASGGDGMRTAALFLSLLSETRRSLREWRDEIALFPQKTCSLRVAEKPPLETLAGFREGCRRLEADMGDGGRVLVRYSGTEPKIRLLVEAPEDAVASAAMAALKKEVAKFLKIV